MKLHLLILSSGLLTLPVVTAQNPAETRRDPYVADATQAARPPTEDAAKELRNISMRFEDFSLDLATAASLQREDLSDSELYQRLIAMVGKKEAHLESLTIVRCRSGEKVISEAVLETIYPTEYEPAELPNTVGVSISPPKPAGDAPAPATIPDTDRLQGAPAPSQLGELRTPATPTAFETRNTGRTIEVEGTLGDDTRVLDLRLSTESIRHAGSTKHGQGLSTVEMPDFESQRSTTAATIIIGRNHLIGTLNRPPNSKLDADAANRVWFAFVTPTLAKP